VHLLKLYLYDNNIQQITNLEMLVDLQVLWLNKNQISDIQVAYLCVEILYIEFQSIMCFTP